MFPDRAYLLALVAVLAAAVMDILTKSYSIVIKNGGYKNAVKSKALFSKMMWRGTERKIVSYLTIAILTGLSYRDLLERSGNNDWYLCLFCNVYERISKQCRESY